MIGKCLAQHLGLAVSSLSVCHLCWALSHRDQEQGSSQSHQRPATLGGHLGPARDQDVGGVLITPIWLPVRFSALSPTLTVHWGLGPDRQL